MNKYVNFLLKFSLQIASLARLYILKYSEVYFLTDKIYKLRY